MRRELWIAAAVLALGGCKKHEEAGDEEKPAAAAVTCQRVEEGEVADTVDVSGVIAPPPKLDAVVSSPIAGRVAVVSVEEGDPVTAGALLATIEDPALPAGSLEARAGVAAAKANKAAADQEVARQERLVNSGIGARKDLEDARAKAAAAGAELDAANARSGLAASQLARREIRAPRAGVVLHVWKKVGESVDGTAATAIAEVADLSLLELHAQVSTAPLSQLREGMPAKVKIVGSDQELDGKVVRVAPAVDATTLLGLVRVQLAPTSGIAPRVGSAATGQIVVRSHPGIRVPKSALRRSTVGEDEVVVCEGGVAHVRTVKLGRTSTDTVEIQDGVKPGEQVVVDRALGLEDGQPLVPAGSAAK